MKLYYAPAACSLAPHVVLREAGLTFDLTQVDTARHVDADGRDFYAANAKGQVPVLELDDRTRLTEGPVIAQYVAHLSQLQAFVARVAARPAVREAMRAEGLLA